MNTDGLATKFLRWLAANNAGHPNPEAFLKSSEASIDGRAITSDQLEQTVELLHARGLIQGHSTWSKALLRVSLTDEGKLCVHDFGGDVSNWRESKRPQADQSVTVNSGDNTQVAAHASNVTQTQTSSIDTTHLRVAVPIVEDHLDEYRTAGADVEEIQHAASAIKTELAQAAPDENKLRTWGARLAASITPFASAVTITKFVLAMLGTA